MVLQLHVEGACVLFGRFSNTFASKGSPILLPKFGSVFSRTTSFVLKTDYFLIHGLGKCEGVGEDSRHGFWACRHSSRITYLLECVFTLNHYICT